MDGKRSRARGARRARPDGVSRKTDIPGDERPARRGGVPGRASRTREVHARGLRGRGWPEGGACRVVIGRMRLRGRLGARRRPGRMGGCKRFPRFRARNVPSKDFGERIHVENEVPEITAQRALCADRERYASAYFRYENRSGIRALLRPYRAEPAGRRIDSPRMGFGSGQGQPPHHQLRGPHPQHHRHAGASPSGRHARAPRSKTAEWALYSRV